MPEFSAAWEPWESSDVPDDTVAAMEHLPLLHVLVCAHLHQCLVPCIVAVEHALQCVKEPSV